ncbi:hypothetical protein GCK72_023529 [Caenorhabditis remanei]|uniref:JmjC domain-containing protein n=1 Tax=Caenorhabditis remanei TaxID=31234 RepID=A0A6A5FWL0_CAERE|nr:hypothetical protein GCK72_023529 [Caenorhabditis remanei]KAF1747070.1 hypothetical protein GCK72_023529 [Caenorhabditis remanei]
MSEAKKAVEKHANGKPVTGTEDEGPMSGYSSGFFSDSSSSSMERSPRNLAGMNRAEPFALDPLPVEPRSPNADTDWIKEVQGSNAFIEGLSQNKGGVLSNEPADCVEFQKGAIVNEKDIEENMLAGKIVVIRSVNKAAIGLVLPDVTLDNVAKLFKGSDGEYKVRNSKTGQFAHMTIPKMIEYMKENEKCIENDNVNIMNLLSFECTKITRVSSTIKLPLFVQNLSMIKQLKAAINERFGTLKTGSFATSDATPREREWLKKLKNHIPSYENFYIISMKGAFTDLHVDFGGTFVYYFVHDGKKVFYVAPPTAENIEAYRQLEITGKSMWTDNPKMLKNFRKIELNPGDLAFIPTQWLHFVYTPCNSLVYGGNFLTESKLNEHYKMMEIEEECLKNKSGKSEEMFKNFWDMQFAYLKLVYLNGAISMRKANVLLLGSYQSVGYQFLTTLIEKIHEPTINGLFSTDDKTELLNMLERVLSKKKFDMKKPFKSEFTPKLVGKQTSSNPVEALSIKRKAEMKSPSEIPSTKKPFKE